MDAFADAEDVAAVAWVPEGGGMAQMCLICQKHREGDVGGFWRVLEDFFGVENFLVSGSQLVVCAGGLASVPEVGKALVRGRISGFLQGRGRLDVSGSFSLDLHGGAR